MIEKLKAAKDLQQLIDNLPMVRKDYEHLNVCIKTLLNDSTESFDDTVNPDPKPPKP